MQCCPAVPGRDGLATRYYSGWQQVNHLAGVFWRRWIREYLLTLQVRTKWLRASQELERGNLVLVSGENLPRVVDSCEASPDKLVRTLHVRTAVGVLKRDAGKGYLLEGCDCASTPSKSALVAGVDSDHWFRNPAPTLFFLPGGSGITRHSKIPFDRYRYRVA
ncbi:hypothetical protein T265_09314 [Opisthorchis viverrini]|uniref:DUF5641 domain-containing protein n=1 Tax=Opisthorchis viverrini TaxID=6198 RepID=A0A075A5J2_OPIVI|nr:hypothetical protein T265_09314 [Opisthorchis viverrini]KER22654.1 hypothetical protein T265_09314 [Opisthorchis viverrini]